MVQRKKDLNLIFTVNLQTALQLCRLLLYSGPRRQLKCYYVGCLKTDAVIKATVKKKNKPSRDRRKISCGNINTARFVLSLRMCARNTCEHVCTMGMLCCDEHAGKTLQTINAKIILNGMNLSQYNAI